jgi:hypothetical protein
MNFVFACRGFSKSGFDTSTAGRVQERSGAWEELCLIVPSLGCVLSIVLGQMLFPAVAVKCGKDFLH